MYPALMFRCPGPHIAKPIHGGKSYDLIGINDAAAAAAAESNGWHMTYEAACGIVEAKDPDINAPPTRAELEAKAVELGLKFDGRTRDAKLSAMIAEALANVVD